MNEEKSDGLDHDFVDDFSGQKVYVPLVKVISRAAKAIVHNPKAANMLVRELKRLDKGMPVIMEEIMIHPESYSEIAEHIRKNESQAAKKLTKAMHQHYLDHLTEIGALDVSENVSEPMNQRLPQNETMPMPMAMGNPTSTPAVGMGMGGMSSGGGPKIPGGPFGGGGSNYGPTGPLNNAGAKEFGYHHMIREMGKHDNMKNVMREMMDK